MNQVLPIIEESTVRSLLSAEERDEALIAQLLSVPLPAADANVLVHWLKQEADAAWYRDPRRTLDYGQFIEQIGTARNDARQIALGLMTQGDALRFLNRAADAWAKLDQAGSTFLSAGDQFGWARTRIGCLGLSTELGFVEIALRDAQEARTIFSAHGDQEMMLRLDLNTAVVHDLLGDHAQALARYEAALAVAQTLGERGERYLPILYTNMGYAANFLGDLRRALDYYSQAKTYMVARSETSGIINIDLALAYIALGQGHYQRALTLLHDVVERAEGQYPKETALARREMIECYLALNQFRTARDFALQVSAAYEHAGADHDRARTLLLLAEAEANLGQLGAASEALDDAERIFTGMNAAPWASTAQLRRAQIAVQQGDLDRALSDAQSAATTFAASQRPFYQAQALLAQAQAELKQGDPHKSQMTARRVLALVRQSTPALRYSAQLVLGQAALALGKTRAARRHLQSAVAQIERAQQQLTITFRSAFLDNRVEALHALIGLYLTEGQAAEAFVTLERAKSLTLLTYLNGRDQLHWLTNDARTTALVEELAALRAEHHWYYRIAFEQIEHEQRSGIQADEAARRLADCERRIRAITEKLYLRSAGQTAVRSVTAPAFSEIQSRLPAGSALLEYYAHGDDLWVFVVQHDGITAHHLPQPPTEVGSQIERLQLNIDRALRLGQTGPQDQLRQHFEGIAARLYDALLAPIKAVLAGCSRLYIVPSGALHYLPFHLLRGTNGYLIETHEIVTLPAAALLTRPAVHRNGDAVALTYSWDGKVPQTRAEAEIVARCFPTTAYHEGEAVRDQLAHTPCSLLHIAAHSVFRMDEPDFSFLQLAGDPLFLDDLLQYDLSYELVTLSACETGRAHVTSGDELIGLGQGFLYSGAGALIASLWRIEDGATLPLMEHLYRGLRGGQSKVAALRTAQVAAQAGLHPAFWGAFILIGSPDPLTNVRDHEGEQHGAA